MPKQESTEAVVPTAAAVSNCGAISNSAAVSNNVSASNNGTKSFLRQALLATTSQSFTRLRHSSSGLVTTNSNNPASTLATSGGRIGNQSQQQSSDVDQPFANIDTSSIAGMDCLDIDLLVKNHQHQEELAGAVSQSSSNTSTGDQTYEISSYLWFLMVP